MASAVEKGFKNSIDNGVLAGFPCLDFKVTLLDGAYHAVDSSAVAFEIAARAAYRQSIPKAGPQLIEPIMHVDVYTPEDHVGDVIGDINRRRGMIKSQEAGVTGVRIKADVALSEMFGYIGDFAHNDIWSRPILYGILSLLTMPQKCGRRSH